MEGVAIRTIFTPPRTFGLRVIFLSLASLALAHFDVAGVLVSRYRRQTDVLVAPVRQLVNQPIYWIQKASQALLLQRDLVEENNQLRIKEILLQSNIQRMLELQRENQQLKTLLKSPITQAGKVTVGQLLAVDLSPGLHQVILDKGEKEGVFVGQPVLDAYGVMGQVVDYAPNTSKVLLITDSRSAVPVQNYRTGARAILSGTGDNHTLELVGISPLADIKQGDLYVTSGFGQRFPPGYPVGEVNGLLQTVGQKFLRVTLLPMAHLDQTQRVLLIWPGSLKLRDQVKALLQKPLPTPGGNPS